MVLRAGASDLLAEVPYILSIGLSNTNVLHWEYQIDRWPILEVFDDSFLSFGLGLVKPDSAVFAEVADRLSVDPGGVLFLDNNALNTDAASLSGFLAEHVRGVAEARRALVESGVLAA